MGCCSEPATALSIEAPDPSQHVNFAKGMVLGVDDFKQEFAYLAGRGHWLARDAIGYGTLSGLRVLPIASGADGPMLQVKAGSALVPSGKLVCVRADQCAAINKWLAKPENAAIVHGLLNPVSPPLSPPLSPPFITSPPANMSGRISLYLRLCYADCLTRPVPIPGEPCRSEEELMEDSRVAEDFRLELRPAPPLQVEEDALRDFVRWLRTNLHVVTTSPPPPADEEAWLSLLRPGAQPWLDQEAVSPPVSPPATVEKLGDYLFDLPAPGIVIAQDQMCAFLRVAFRFWVTELRPLWMAKRCHRDVHGDQDCVLLARIEFEVEWIGGSPTGVFQIVDGPAPIVVDETKRPFLAHLRLLQEWALCGCDCGVGVAAGLEASPPSPPSAPEAPLDQLFFISAPRVPVLVTGSDVVLGEGDHLVVGRGGATVDVTLPRSNRASAGRTFVVRNVDVTSMRLIAAAGDTVEAATVPRKNTLTLAADGAGGWLVIGSDKRP